MAEYRNKLLDVLWKIKADFDIAEIRGSDLGSFIFAEKKNRAIEIYQSNSTVIVEFWVDGSQQTKNEVDSYRETINLVVDWMNKSDEK